MKKESKLQSDIAKWLRSKGCYVLVTTPGAGVSVGCPDIIGLIEGCWLAIEVKTDAKSPFQALQRETIAKLNKWSWAKVVHKDNWEKIKKELEVFIG